MRADNFWYQALIASESLGSEIDELVKERVSNSLDTLAGLPFTSRVDDIKENIKGILLAFLTLKNETDEEQ